MVLCLVMVSVARFKYQKILNFSLKNPHTQYGCQMEALENVTCENDDCSCTKLPFYK